MPSHKNKGKKTTSHRHSPLARPGTHPRTNFDNHSLFAPKPKSVIVEQPLSDFLNTPIAIHRFQHGILESFDQAVRDLIQSDPDHPIGGYPASPMVKPKIYSTKSTDIELVNMVSMAAISAARDSPSQTSKPSKPAETRHTFSRALLSRSANTRASILSELSLPMITAPQTPSRCCQSDDDYAAIGIRDFADDENSYIGECSDTPCMGNRLDGPACCSLEAEAQGLEICPASFEDMCLGPELCPERPSPRIDPTDHLREAQGPNECPTSIGDMCPGLDDCPKRPSHRVDLTDLPESPAAALESDLPSPPASQPRLLQTTSAPIRFLSSDGPPVKIPIDTTGLQTVPPTPPKRSTKKQKFLRGIRKTRVACLRKPVLTVVVGRQLSEVTRTALKAIADREMPDLDAIEAVGLSVPKMPAPAPIPA